MDMDYIINVLLISILVLMLVFFITRWFWCWYFKINARYDEAREANALLIEIRDLLKQNGQPSEGWTSNVDALCSKCGESLPDDAAFCGNCGTAFSSR